MRNGRTRLVQTAKVRVNDSLFYFVIDHERDYEHPYRMKALESVGMNDTVVITDTGFVNLIDAVQVLGDAFIGLRHRAKKMRAAQKGRE